MISPFSCDWRVWRLWVWFQWFQWFWIFMWMKWASKLLRSEVCYGRSIPSGSAPHSFGLRSSLQRLFIFFKDATKHKRVFEAAFNNGEKIIRDIFEDWFLLALWCDDIESCTANKNVFCKHSHYVVIFYFFYYYYFKTASKQSCALFLISEYHKHPIFLWHVPRSGIGTACFAL